MQLQAIAGGYMQNVINGMHAKFNSQQCNQRYNQMVSFGFGGLPPTTALDAGSNPVAAPNLVKEIAGDDD